MDRASPHEGCGNAKRMTLTSRGRSPERYLRVEARRESPRFDNVNHSTFLLPPTMSRPLASRIPPPVKTQVLLVTLNTGLLTPLFSDPVIRQVRIVLLNRMTWREGVWRVRRARTTRGSASIWSGSCCEIDRRSLLGPRARLGTQPSLCALNDSLWAMHDDVLRRGELVFRAEPLCSLRWRAHRPGFTPPDNRNPRRMPHQLWAGLS